MRFIHKSRIQFTLGIVFGVLGCVLVAVTMLASPSGTSTASAATTSYNGQWLIDTVRTYDFFTNGGLRGSIDVGPSVWKVRYCVGNTMSSGSATSLGDCSGGGKRIDETWSVSDWAAQPHIFNDNNTTHVNPRDRKSSSINSNEIDYNAGSGQCNPSGTLFRSGLYGVTWATGSGCDFTHWGLFWSYSEIPAKWKVTGTITDL